MNKLRRSLSVGLLASVPGISVLNKILFPVVQAKQLDIALDQDFLALIDTFVPADESPGAIDFGIHQTLLDSIRANQDYLNVIRQTLSSLDALTLAHYDMHFGLATLSQRSEIVSRVLGTQAQFEDVRIQLSSLRTRTLSAFYGSEAVFEMLDYHPPSQGGYPDYDRPPV